MSRARDNAHVSGRTIQTVQRFSSNQGTVSTSAYNNDPNNLVQIPDHYVDIVTKSTNSRIKVSFSFDNMGPNVQHSYTDLRRSINGGSFTSMAINYRTGTQVDSLASFHTVSTGNVEHSAMYTIIDSPNVAVGTTLRYQVYMGSWAGGTVTFGGWNFNATSLTIMIAEELAQ
jgi:hypothetical protein